MPNPPRANGVTITNREIFDAVNQTRDMVKTLEGKLDRVVDRQQRTEEDVRDLDGRTDKLEERRWPLQVIPILLSLTAVVVAIAATVAPRMV